MAIAGTGLCGVAVDKHENIGINVTFERIDRLAKKGTGNQSFHMGAEKLLPVGVKLFLSCRFPQVDHQGGGTEGSAEGTQC